MGTLCCHTDTAKGTELGSEAHDAWKPVLNAQPWDPGEATSQLLPLLLDWNDHIPSSREMRSQWVHRVIPFVVLAAPAQPEPADHPLAGTGTHLNNAPLSH